MTYIEQGSFDSDRIRSHCDFVYAEHGRIIVMAYETFHGKQELNASRNALLILIDPQKVFLYDNQLTRKLGGRSAGTHMTNKWVKTAEYANMHGGDLLVSLMIHDPDHVSLERVKQLTEGPCQNLVYYDASGRLRFPDLEIDSPLTGPAYQFIKQAVPLQTVKVKHTRSLLENPDITSVLQEYKQVLIGGIDSTVCIWTTVGDYLRKIKWNPKRSDWPFELSLIPQLISDRIGNFELLQELYRFIIEVIGEPRMISVKAYEKYLMERKKLLKGTIA